MGHHRPASETPLNGVLLAADDAGDTDQYCKETLHFCAFSRGGPDHLSPSGYAHAPQNRDHPNFD